MFFLNNSKNVKDLQFTCKEPILVKVIDKTEALKVLQIFKAKSVKLTVSERFYRFLQNTNSSLYRL